MAKFKIGDEIIMNDNTDKNYRYTCKRLQRYGYRYLG